MASEAEIQAFVEGLIKKGQLHAMIEGKDQIEQAFAAHNSSTFIPNFNLDYLLRIQSVTSTTFSASGNPPQRTWSAVDGANMPECVGPAYRMGNLALQDYAFSLCWI